MKLLVEKLGHLQVDRRTLNLIAAVLVDGFVAVAVDEYDPIETEGKGDFENGQRVPQSFAYATAEKLAAEGTCPPLLSPQVVGSLRQLS